MIVFTLGMSTPLSTIFVQTSTSYFLSIKSMILSSSSCPSMSMGEAYAEVGAEAPDDGGHFGKAMNPVIDEEHLPPPYRLIINSVPDEVLVIPMELRLDRLAVGGRGIDDAEIPGAHQAELQGPGYGRGREGKTI